MSQKPVVRNLIVVGLMVATVVSFVAIAWPFVTYFRGVAAEIPPQSSVASTQAAHVSSGSTHLSQR